MNDENIEDTIKEKYGEKALESMLEIRASVNHVVIQTNNFLSQKHLGVLGEQKYYLTFSCALKTVFCGFFLQSIKNKSKKDIAIDIDTVLQDAREYMFNRL